MQMKINLRTIMKLHIKLFQSFQAKTIHKWAGIGDGRHSIEQLRWLILHDERYSQTLQRVKETCVLTIHEICMLSHKFFDMVGVCRIRDGSKAFFGGIKVDFHQLPR